MFSLIHTYVLQSLDDSHFCMFAFRDVHANTRIIHTSLHILSIAS